MNINFLSTDKPNLIVLVGLPASGKSTFRYRKEFKSFSHVSSDDYIDYFAKSRGKKYNDVWNECVEHAQVHSQTVLDGAIKRKNNIIVDRTNLTIKSRRITTSKVKKSEWNIVAVEFIAGRDVIKSRMEERFKKTGKSIPDSVIDDMVKWYQPVDVSLEGFDSVYFMEQ